MRKHVFGNESAPHTPHGGRVLCHYVGDRKNLPYTIEDRSYTTPCWMFGGYIIKSGYGKAHGEDHQHTDSAHRLSYVFHRGAIPEDMEIHHRCKVRACINPDHLEPLTGLINTYLGPRGKCNLYCKHGHLLLGDNMRIEVSKLGIQKRQCRTCAREIYIKISRQRIKEKQRGITK
jgi:hypothetical protein